jgi:2-oxo-3-hexenedioate decarboxylase
MALSKTDILAMVAQSISGEFNHHAIDQFCKQYPALTEAEAYEGQSLRIKQLEEKGYRVVGYKLGGTSLAKQKQLKSTIYSENGLSTKVSSVVYGRLMDYMMLSEHDDLDFSKLLHPKVEAELAFIMKSDIQGKFISAPDVLMATAFIAPAFEIIDSRFHDFKIGSRYDAIIDNTSSARFKLGTSKMSPAAFDLTAIGVRLERNGENIGFGATASVMGHPARAVADLVRALSKEGKGLKAGDIVLSGAIMPSVPAMVGDTFLAEFGSLGKVEIKIK